ncbi:MAG: efflux RND transporter periplasmic adaptor subunit [Phycisphaerales bacterium JB059]
MNQQDTRSGVHRARRAIRLAVRVVAPGVVLVAALLGAERMMETTPKTPRRPPERLARLVEVQRFEASTRAVLLDTAMGVVMPARSVELKPQVSGRVEWLEPELHPGAIYASGSPLVRIERADFELAVAEQRAAIASAEADLSAAEASVITAENDLALEMGNQSVSLREYELLGESIDDANRDLVLRVPQLKAAQAAVQSAEATVEAAQAAKQAAETRLAQAELNLQRTEIRAPYNVVVAEKHVDVGDVVSSTTPVLTLYGIDEFWIELAIPSSQLRWVEEGVSRVRLSNPAAWGPDRSREGRVLRLLPDVDSGGRMARVLVSVPDPKAHAPENAGLPQLLVNDYLTATIEGRSVEGVIELPRTLVREGETVWVMNDRDELEIRPIQMAYRGREHVLVSSGLASGERVVTSDLAAPVAGMPLREQGETGATP